MSPAMAVKSLCTQQVCVDPKIHGVEVRRSDDDSQIACISPDKKSVVVYDVVTEKGGGKKLKEKYRTPDLAPSIAHADFYFPRADLQLRVKDKSPEDKARIEALATTPLCIVVLNDGRLLLLVHQQHVSGSAFSILASIPLLNIREPRFTVALASTDPRTDDKLKSLAGIKNPVATNIGIICSNGTPLTLLYLIRLDNSVSQKSHSSSESGPAEEPSPAPSV